MTENQSSLWSADEECKKNSQLEKFCKHLEKRGFFKNNSNFQDLWNWSIKNPENFWSEVWDFTKIRGTKEK